MRDQLSLVFAANTIKMKRTQFAGAFILVEGDDDSKLFRKFVDLAACEIQSCHGKPRVVASLAQLISDQIPGVVGVIDADTNRCQYHAVNPDEAEAPHLLWCDFHDAEMMMIASAALESVCLELGSVPPHRYAEVRTALLAAAAPVGALRLMSRAQNLSMKFDGLDFTRFVDRDAVIDAGQMLTAVETLSRRSAGDRATVLTEVHRLVAATDPWNLCCGHDVVEVLSIGLQRRWGSRRPAEVTCERLEASLRMSFERVHFDATDIKTKCDAWVQRNNGYRLLP